MMAYKVEICCGSYEDCLNAWKGGAKRVELNSALFLGGLTPSLAALTLTKQNTGLQVIAMTRPRAAGFCYSEVEFEQLMLDAKLLLEHGADGIAFGCLSENFEVDIQRTNQMVNLVHGFHQSKEVVFHRAFDCVSNPDQAMETLIKLKVDRVLTSGLQATALKGRTMLKYLQEKYASQIEILAGSGINEENVGELIKETKITQIHSSCKDWIQDPTTSSQQVSYCYHEGNEYEIVSIERVQKLLASVRKRQK